jgi:hypothetical protein
MVTRVAEWDVPHLKLVLVVVVLDQLEAPQMTSGSVAQVEML